MALSMTLYFAGAPLSVGQIMKTRTPILKIQNLEKSYYSDTEEFKILKGLNFEINHGDFVSIMGPSGSGKSTLMHILGGLDKPTRGSYLLRDREIADLDDDSLSRVRNTEIGFVFQAFYLVPHNTVLENVLLPSRYCGTADENYDRAVKLLDAIGLGERLHFRPNQISGGQCQRAAIARALLNNPSIIMADEPTGNLDSSTGQDILAILQYLHSIGKTIIMVTHERDVAEHTEKVLHLRDGSIETWETMENRRFAEGDLDLKLDHLFQA